MVTVGLVWAGLSLIYVLHLESGDNPGFSPTLFCCFLGVGFLLLEAGRIVFHLRAIHELALRSKSEVNDKLNRLLELVEQNSGQ